MAGVPAGFLPLRRWCPLLFMPKPGSIVYQPHPCGFNPPHRGVDQLLRQDSVGFLEERKFSAVHLPPSSSGVSVELLAQTSKLNPADFMPLLAVALNGASHGGISHHRLSMSGCWISHHIQLQIIINHIEQRCRIGADAGFVDGQCEHLMFPQKPQQAFAHLMLSQRRNQSRARVRERGTLFMFEMNHPRFGNGRCPAPTESRNTCLILAGISSRRCVT